MYTLARADLTEEVLSGRTAWALGLTVTSSDADLYPPKVFVFQQEDPDPVNSRAWFTCVANPAQLLEYPVDEPAPPVGELWQPYFRVATLQLVSRNADELERIYLEVATEIRNLRENLDAMVTLTDGGEVTL